MDDGAGRRRSSPPCGPPDQPVVEMPAVSSVTVGGPAHQKLLPGDLIVSVDDVATPTSGQVVDLIRKHKVGEKVGLRRRPQQGRTDHRGGDGRVADPERVAGGRDLGGQGLSLRAEHLLRASAARSADRAPAWCSPWPSTTRSPRARCYAGRHLAGTGAISADGDVGSIGGIQEKIAGAEQSRCRGVPGAGDQLRRPGRAADRHDLDQGVVAVRRHLLHPPARRRLDRSAPLLMTVPDTERADALIAALLDLDRHLSTAAWEQPTRLFALVLTDDLAVAEPELAAQLGLRTSAEGAPVGALTAIEQDTFVETGDLLADLAAVAWPAEVFGCAVSTERTFLPAAYENDLPDDPEAAAAVVAGHPHRAGHPRGDGCRPHGQPARGGPTGLATRGTARRRRPGARPRGRPGQDPDMTGRDPHGRRGTRTACRHVVHRYPELTRRSSSAPHKRRTP